MARAGSFTARRDTVEGPEVGKSTVGLRRREETGVSRVSECGGHGSEGDGPQSRGGEGRPWRPQGVYSSMTIKFWEGF